MGLWSLPGDQALPELLLPPMPQASTRWTGRILCHLFTVFTSENMVKLLNAHVVSKSEIYSKG